MSELDVLYQDTVTLFNRHMDEEDETICWVPTVLRGVHLVVDRAKIISTYGENSTDHAMLNIRYKGNRNEPYIDGKRYVQPKEFRRMDIDQASDCITFSFGDDFDFIIAGEWEELGNAGDVVYNDYYDKYLGFFDYMNLHYDNVFAISGVSQYNLIPHFTVTAR